MPKSFDRTGFRCGALALFTLVSQPALAQRTQQNAVTQASDAFGSSVGNERTGLYNPDDVRGFNPVDAGNARLEGLYFDQIGMTINRLIEGNTIRVGITAQGYPFPAPTGLVDYRLIKPDAGFEGTVSIEGNSLGGANGSLELKVPLDGQRLGISGGIGFRYLQRPEGGSSLFLAAGATAVFRPRTGAELVAFAGAFKGISEEARPTLFPAGSVLPPEIARRQFFGQDWAARSTEIRLFGAKVRWPLGAWRLEAGLFRASRAYPQLYSDLLTGVSADGRAAARTIIADGNNAENSLSGEARLVREWQQGSLANRLSLSLRGRSRNRTFGGSVPIALGPSFADRPDARPEPAITLGPENTDQVRQVTLGAAYSLSWSGRGSLDLGLSTSRYRKVVDFAAPGLPTITSRDRPLLWNVASSVILTPHLALYAGYVSGQEEALIAPDIATNRAETPPAIRTHQFDAGVRAKPFSGLTLVAGVFSITKPYFNLDPAKRYRQLGAVTNRGIELSLTGQLAPGLSLLAGTVLLDPRISGEAVSTGLIGPRPVGQLRRRTILNLDWRPGAGSGPLSFDLALESLSARNANAGNTLAAPAQETVNLGSRYRFNLAANKALLRFQVLNALNNYGWQVSTSGGFTYTNPRTAELQLLVDF